MCHHLGPSPVRPVPTITVSRRDAPAARVNNAWPQQRAQPVCHGGTAYRQVKTCGPRERSKQQDVEAIGADRANAALPGQTGGGEGNRTPGLNSAIVALCQLSYTPAGLAQDS